MWELFIPRHMIESKALEKLAAQQAKAIKSSHIHPILNVSGLSDAQYRVLASSEDALRALVAALRK